MRLDKLTSGLDQLGMTASILCALHCLLVPVLLTALPFAGLAFLMQSWVDMVMIAAGLAIGLVSLGMSFARHRRLLPILLLLAGFAVIGAVHLTHSHTAVFPDYSRINNIADLPDYHTVHTPLEIAGLFAGGICIAAGHLVNWRYNRRRHPENESHLHIIKKSA